MTTRVLCVKFPNWPVQRVQAEWKTPRAPRVESPASSEQTAGPGVHASDSKLSTDTSTLSSERAAPPPLIVLYRSSPQGGLTVCACSDAATEIGVFTSMTLAEANALVNSATHVATQRKGAGGRSSRKDSRKDNSDISAETAIFLEHDADEDLRALKALAVDCQRFSPLVGLESDRQFTMKSARHARATEPEQNSLLLDISGCAHLFGGESQLAESLEALLASRGYVVEIGFGNTIGEAWAMAHYGTGITDTPKSSMTDLGTLPIEALRIPSNVAAALREFGVKQIHQLQALPRKSLPSRFGKEVLQRLDQAFGRMTEVIVPERSNSPIHVEWIFEYPTSHRETIDTVIQRLLQSLTDQLVPRCEGVLQLDCRLYCSPSEVESQPAPLVVSVGVVEPTQSADLLYELLDLHLEAGLIRVGDRTGAKITSISVSTIVTIPISIQQQQLFETDRSRDESGELTRLLNRLSNRLGKESVLRPRLLPDAQPELAFQHMPLVSGSSNRTGSTAASNTPPGSRPLRLMPEPERIEVGLSDSGVPQQLGARRPNWRGQSQQTVGDTIVRAWGPERIETGWWRGQHVRRDYYRVEITSGEQYWIFRDLQSLDWFLHGAFE